MLKSWKEKREMVIRYKRLFGSDDGQKVLKDLMKSCFIMHSTLDTDPIHMAHNEGARSIVLRILTTIQTDPEQMQQMLELGLSEGDENEHQVI